MFNVHLDQLIHLVKQLKEDSVLFENKKIKEIIEKAEEVEFDIEFCDVEFCDVEL